MIGVNSVIILKRTDMTIQRWWQRSSSRWRYDNAGGWMDDGWMMDESQPFQRSPGRRPIESTRQGSVHWSSSGSASLRLILLSFWKQLLSGLWDPMRVMHTWSELHSGRSNCLSGIAYSLILLLRGKMLLSWVIATYYYSVLTCLLTPPVLHDRRTKSDLDRTVNWVIIMMMFPLL